MFNATAKTGAEIAIWGAPRMSDRVRTQSVEFSQDCPNCVVTPTGYEFCAAHLAALRGERKNNNRSVSSPAAPVEPPVLSRASIDELIDAYFSRQQFISQQIAGGVRHGMIALRDAILESLSQEASE